MGANWIQGKQEVSLQGKILVHGRRCSLIAKNGKPYLEIEKHVFSADPSLSKIILLNYPCHPKKYEFLRFHLISLPASELRRTVYTDFPKF